MININKKGKVVNDKLEDLLIRVKNVAQSQDLFNWHIVKFLKTKFHFEFQLNYYDILRSKGTDFMCVFICVF